MNEAIESEVKTLFAKRRPGMPPDPYVVKKWVEHLCKLDNMTLEKVKAGCQLLGGIEARLDLGALVKAIELEAAKAYNEEQRKELRKTRDESKAEDRKPPLPFMLSMAYFDLEDEDEKADMRKQIIEACEAERKKYPAGSEMGRGWNKAARDWK